MGVVFSPWEIGRRALQASQVGINVTSNNIANVNTPGYTRQTVHLAESTVSANGTQLVGNGVTVQSVTGVRDQFINARLETESAINGRLTAQSDTLTPVDAALNDTNTSGGISSTLNAFFGAFRDLEANPTSAAVRTAVVGKGNALAVAFNSTRSRLTGLQKDADLQLQDSVKSVNDLTSQVATLNKKIRLAEANGSNTSELIDQRSQATVQLAELAGTHTTQNSDGSVTLTLGDGRALVQGDISNQLTVSSQPPSGLSQVELDGQPAVIADGKIKGIQDGIASVGNIIQSIDDLASSVATSVNSLHSAGVDLHGNAGTNFFTVPVSGPITAANFSVSSSIQADASLVVSGATGSGTADSSVARSIANLISKSDSTAGTRTGTFSAIYASVVSDAGNGVRSAQDQLTTQQAVLSQVQAQRDSISGVSLDEEAVNLLQYQKAYEAAARVLRVADEMTQTILQLGQ